MSKSQDSQLTSNSIHKGADVIMTLIQVEKVKAVAEACSELHELKDHLAQLREKSARQSQEAELATRALQDAHSQVSHWQKHCLVVEKERDKIKQALQVVLAGSQQKISSLRAEINVLENNRGQPFRETASNPNEVSTSSNTLLKSASASSERESSPPSKQNPDQHIHVASDTAQSSQILSIAAGVPASETGGNAVWSPADSTVHQRNPPAENSSLTFPPLVPSGVSEDALPSTSSGTAAPLNIPKLLRKFQASLHHVSDSQTMAQSHFIGLPTAIPTSKMSPPVGAVKIEDEKGSLKRPHSLPDSAPSNTKRSKPNHIVDAVTPPIRPMDCPSGLALPTSKI